MQKVKSLLIFTILATVALAVVACSESPNEITTSPDTDIVEWTLISLGDPNAPQSVLEGTSIIMAITEEDDDFIGFRGSAGCNSYFGSFQMSDDGLEAGPIGATEMWCVDEEVMGQEGQYLGALGTANGYEISGDTLEITYDSGVLIFTAE